MRVTASDLLQLGVIDRIIAEPMGGAHRDPAATIKALGSALEDELDSLSGLSSTDVRKARRDKYLSIA